MKHTETSDADGSQSPSPRTADAVASRPSVNLTELQALVGSAATYSAWRRVTQAAVDDFARVTGDCAFIHVDPERASTTRFGGTIAHGLYTLSLLPAMLAEATPRLRGTRMGVNYGFERVRFVTPVPVGQQVRGSFHLVKVEERALGHWIVSYDVTVEVEGANKPALSAHWLLGRWLSDM